MDVVEGAPEDVARRIVGDGRTGAAAEAARFAARDVLMVGAWAHLVSRSPLYRFDAAKGDADAPHEYAFPRTYLGDDPDMFLAAPQRLKPLRDAWMSVTERGAGGGRRWADALDGVHGTDEDIRLMACATVRRVHEAMDKAIRRTEVAQAARGALREAWERLLPWRLRSEIGQVAPREAETALRAAESGIAALAAARSGFDPAMPLAYIRQVAYPALAATAAAMDGDADALAALAPAGPR